MVQGSRYLRTAAGQSGGISISFSASAIVRGSENQTEVEARLRKRRIITDSKAEIADRFFRISCLAVKYAEIILRVG